MQNFSFLNPTKIEFGKDKEQNIGKYMKEFGVKKRSSSMAATGS